MRRLALLCILAPVVTAPAMAQDVAGHRALGIAAAEARDPAAALRHFEAALALDSTDYESGWRAAIAAVDIGKQTPDSVVSAERDALYALAERHARRAVLSDPFGADGHFALAVAIGRASLTLPTRERIKRAEVVRLEASRALELNPEHDGAWHVIGRWHAEVMRLSGLERFFARNFLGGDVFGLASWSEAERALNKAVEYRPEYIYHRLDLAEVYVDQEKFRQAESQLRAIPSLPLIDVLDPQYKRDAARLLDRIAARGD